MFTLTIAKIITGDGAGLNGSASVQTEACDKRQVVLAADSADVEIDLPIDASAVKGLVLFCTADATVKTNSTSDPGDTFDLKANRDVSWMTDDLGTVPLSADVTKLYVSCTAGGTITVWVFSDPTP